MKIPNRVYKGQLILTCFISGKLSVGVGGGGGGEGGSEKIAHHMKGKREKTIIAFPLMHQHPHHPHPHPLIIDRSQTSTSGCVQNGNKS